MKKIKEPGLQMLQMNEVLLYFNVIIVIAKVITLIQNIMLKRVVIPQ